MYLEKTKIVSDHMTEYNLLEGDRDLIYYVEKNMKIIVPWSLVSLYVVLV